MNRRTLFGLAVALGLVTAASLGCSRNDASAATGSPGTARSGEVDIVANDKGFTPSSVDVKKGAATTLVFQRTTDDTCAKQVVFPELKITKDLPLNEKVSFDVPSADARTLTFQCGMGMFKGKIVVQ